MEQRHFKRVSFFTQAEIALAGQSFKTEVIDLSLKGALVRKPETFLANPAQTLQLTVKLNETDESIRMHVNVVHQHADFLGLHCIAIDIEGISHLRRLLELNLGDASLLERELAELSTTD